MSRMRACTVLGLATVCMLFPALPSCGGAAGGGGGLEGLDGGGHSDTSFGDGTSGGCRKSLKR